MKKILLSLAALAGVALVGCNKNGLEGPDVVGGRSARVSISLKGANLGSTKALPVEADEILVNSVDAFVFNASGDLDAYRHYESANFTSTGSVTTLNEGEELECTTGAGKTVYVVINGSDEGLLDGEKAFEQIASLSELQARVFKLQNNKKSEGDPAADVLKSFEMIGSSPDQTFHAGENTVDVEVSRTVARVVIKKITKQFASAALSGPLHVRNIYMSNVVGTFGFDGTHKTAATDTWINKYLPADSADPASKPTVDIQSDFNLWLNAGLPTPPIDLTESSPMSEGYTFYVMANDVPWGYDADGDEATPDDMVAGPFGGPSWSPRHTKLVIETTYGDNPTVYYYSIPIAENGVYPMGDDSDDGTGYAGLQANHSYEIDELVLTRLGSTNPDEPTVAAQVQFNITVKDWDKVVLQTETGKYVI